MGVPTALRLILTLWLALATPVAAGPAVSGQDDPRFAAALDLWLADDEHRALPAFAALAAAGNRAAQILLALIDGTPPYQGPWLSHLTRAERIALLRAPGGLSGRSWMPVAATDTPIARLWAEGAFPNSTASTAMALAAAGERRAARLVLQRLSARQYRGFAAVAGDPAYPPDLRYLVWREWAEHPGGAARVRAEADMLMPGDPQLRRVADRPATPDETAAWLAAAPLAAPLRAACAATCPGDIPACTWAAFVLVGGHDALAAFGTPSEALVAAETWDASPRGPLSLLRQAAARSNFADVVFTRVRARDQCLAAALAAETSRFYE